MTKGYTFAKEERLCRQKDIEQLFANNKSFVTYPIRILYRFQVGEFEPPKLLVSVSKRNFKRANKRNRIKRLMRESYRLNKMELYDYCIRENIKLNLAFLFLKKELPNYNEIEFAISKSIGIIIDQLKKDEKIVD